MSFESIMNFIKKILNFYGAFSISCIQWLIWGEKLQLMDLRMKYEKWIEY